MNEFRLFAHGDAFDVDAFLASTTLRPDYIWRRGDQRRYACIESSHPTSGIELVLGDGRKIPLFEQQKIAIEYLSANREALQALAAYPGVTAFILGLQYYIQLDPSTVGLCMGPSPWLMWHCLDIGVWPTFYVSLDRRHEWESDQDVE
jgi:hypothetical protein